MPSRPNRRTRTAPRRRARRGRRPFKATGWFLVRRWKTLRRLINAVLKSPPGLRAVLIISGLVLLWLGANWAYHAVNKPSEVLFPLDHALNKGPADTWAEYGPLFREHATAIITADLLAALAQTEGAGNPVARTYWRWQPSWNPFEWYRPASSAVGMYQITDGTFDQARRYCIHDHRVVEDGPWHDLNSCWFNRLYSRVVPSHAIELTAAHLDRAVAHALGHRLNGAVTLRQKQDLAAMMHLCGAGAGQDYVRRGLRLTPHQHCGDHDVQTYLSRITFLKSQFAALAAGGRTLPRISR